MTIGVRDYGGGGPLVVLLHGWCCAPEFWRAQAGALVPEFRVVAPDLNAFLDGSFMVAAGQEIASLVRRTSATRGVTLVGHSMGGAIAIEAASRLGGLCKVVIGVDTFTDAGFYEPLSAAEIEARLLPFRENFSGAMERMVDRITLSGGESLKRSIAADMGAAEPVAARARLHALLEWNIASKWGAVPKPVVAINSAPLSRGMSRVELSGLVEIAMDGVGHFSMLEAPAEFNAILLRALRDSQSVSTYAEDCRRKDNCARFRNGQSNCLPPF
jgi:pimeloyl-ACP methyl ester carboxylesterase